MSRQHPVLCAHSLAVLILQDTIGGQDDIRILQPSGVCSSLAAMEHCHLCMHGSQEFHAI